MSAPPNNRTFAQRKPDGSYAHFYRSRFSLTSLCGVPEDEVVEVLLIPDPEGGYWCWHDFERNEYCMCWHDFRLLEICFTYGIEPEEKRGKGIRVQVRIEEVRDERPA